MLATHLGDAARLSDEQAKWPLVVGPDYPHLESVVNGRQRKLLLGRSHPLQCLPEPGRYVSSEGILVPPISVVALGGDGKGVPRDLP